MANRISYGKLTDIIEPPDLIEIQKNSYTDFLQLGVTPMKHSFPAGDKSVRVKFVLEGYNEPIRNVSLAPGASVREARGRPPRSARRPAPR